MMPRAHPVARPAFSLGLSLAFLGLLPACGERPADGTNENAAANEPASDAFTREQNAEWVERQRRARRPDLAAQLESSARAVEARPDDASAHGEYGWALFQAGEIEPALVELKRAVELGADGFMPQQRLGMALVRADQPTAGIVHLERALASRPGDADTHFLLGHAFARTDRTDEAMEQFRLTTVANADHAEAYYEQGLLLLDGDPEQATERFEKALDVYEFYAGACSNLARLYRKAGRKEESERMLERHREIALLSDLGVLSAPFSAKRYVAESGFYGRQQKTEKALEIVDRGLELHPSEGRLWEGRGTWLEQSGDFDGARNAMARAWELRPDDREVAIALLDLYRRPDAPEVPQALQARFDGAAQRWPEFKERLERTDPR